LFAVAALAWLGVVAGHLLAYVLAYPHSVHRMEHLAATGHNSLPLPVVCALACAPAVLAVAGLVGAARRPARSVAQWLVGIQVSAFVLLEVVEREFTVGSLVLEPAFLLGLALQVAIALLASVLLRLVTKAVSALVARLWQDRRTLRRIVRPIAQHARANPCPFLISLQGRAPPLPATV
jgi:hypothetical protein